VQKARARTKGAARPERADLAVYTHRVLAVLRPLDAPDCDGVLRAALELNRASHIGRSETALADQRPKPPTEP